MSSEFSELLTTASEVMFPAGARFVTSGLAGGRTIFSGLSVPGFVSSGTSAGVTSERFNPGSDVVAVAVSLSGAAVSVSAGLLIVSLAGCAVGGAFSSSSS